MDTSILAKPEFYDIFGILAFSAIIILTIKSLATKKNLSELSLWILLIIGVAGLLTDIIIVYSKWLR